MTLQFSFDAVVKGYIRVCVGVYMCNHQCACAHRHMHVDLEGQIVGVVSSPPLFQFEASKSSSQDGCKCLYPANNVNQSLYLFLLTIKAFLCSEWHRLAG